MPRFAISAEEEGKKKQLDGIPLPMTQQREGLPLPIPEQPVEQEFLLDDGGLKTPSTSSNMNSSTLTGTYCWREKYYPCPIQIA